MQTAIELIIQQVKTHFNVEIHFQLKLIRSDRFVHITFQSHKQINVKSTKTRINNIVVVVHRAKK